MNTLISGGTGLVGKEIGKVLAKKGHKVFVLTRNKEKALLECPFPHTAINWEELNDLPDIQNIINLAGANLTEKRWSNSFKKTIYNSRIKSTQTLVDFANNQCPNLQAFISTSAIGIYGEADDKDYGEEAQHSYEFLGSLCQDWEAPIDRLKNGRGVILRLGIVFSEKGGALKKMVAPIQNKVGGHLASGKQYMSWIDIDDLVNLFVYAIDNPISGAFNATAPKPISNRDLTTLIAKHLNVRPGPPVPFVALRLAVGEMATNLIESQRILPKKFMQLGYQFKYALAQSSIEERVAKLKGTETRYIFEQWVPKSKEEIFPFFSDAHNLEDITPPSLNFNVTRVSTSEIEEGTEIEYKLKLDGIPIRWKSVITQWNPPSQFADSQVRGPYKKWYHIHKFEDFTGGTLLTDQVDIVLPLGKLGYLASAWKVFKDVEKIFNYRREIISQMYF